MTDEIRVVKKNARAWEASEANKGNFKTWMTYTEKRPWAREVATESFWYISGIHIS